MNFNSGLNNAINKAFQIRIKRNWDHIYFAVDIHDTIVQSNYTAGNIPTEFYPVAMEALQILTERKDVKLIMYTCSHPHEIQQYLDFFESNGIHFDFVNENTDVKTDMEGYGNYDKKPYFNVLLDDKAGFNPYEDWEMVYALAVSAH